MKRKRQQSPSSKILRRSKRLKKIQDQCGTLFKRVEIPEEKQRNIPAKAIFMFASEGFVFGALKHEKLSHFSKNVVTSKIISEFS